MTKRITKLNLSLLPLLIFAAIVAGVYFFFKDDIKLFNNEPEVRRLNGFPTVLITEKELDKQRSIITNEEELSKFFNYVDDTGFLILREQINFDKEILLGTSSSTFNESMHEIKVKKVYIDKEQNKLRVEVRETDPGDTCVTEVQKNIAVDLVAISKTDMEIEFDRVKNTVECE